MRRAHENPKSNVRGGAWLLLALLFAINAVNFYDRQITGALAEPIRREFSLSDTQLGLLGTSFTLLYALVGLPLGRLADTRSRKRMLAMGVALWSAMTFASGLCRSFGQLFAVRLGVGVGEATCAPAATSLIGDLFPAAQRARALSVFMLGLPIGSFLSYLVSGIVGQAYGWRVAFFVAGAPGLLLGVASLFVREPVRGESELAPVGDSRRAGSPLRIVLGTPTLVWIIASGALHNFNMYAIGTFLPALLIRYHHADLMTAGRLAGYMSLAGGAVGMLAGGFLGDALSRHRDDGKLRVAAWALAISVPASIVALRAAPGALLLFVAAQTVAMAAMYAYYGAVYSSIHDVIEPSLRATAMAVYFLAQYLLGASFGPLVTGGLSDGLARREAAEAGVALAPGEKAPEAFRALGLHDAMYVVPALGVLITLVLFAASRTIARDKRGLAAWASAPPRPPSHDAPLVRATS